MSKQFIVYLLLYKNFLQYEIQSKSEHCPLIVDHHQFLPILSFLSFSFLRLNVRTSRLASSSRSVRKSIYVDNWLLSMMRQVSHLQSFTHFYWISVISNFNFQTFLIGTFSSNKKFNESFFWQILLIDFRGNNILPNVAINQR